MDGTAVAEIRLWPGGSRASGTARLREYGITVTIADGIVEGQFPRRAPQHVLEWYELHKEELEANWKRARRQEPLVKTDPLE